MNESFAFWLKQPNPIDIKRHNVLNSMFGTINFVNFISYHVRKMLIHFFFFVFFPRFFHSTYTFAADLYA